jgi:hypothetical protein
MFSKFMLGSVVIDDSVREELQRTPLDLVARHAVCDFGRVTTRVVKQNLIAVKRGGEVVSEYLIDPERPEGRRVRVVTAEGWGHTLVSLVKPQPK